MQAWMRPAGAAAAAAKPAVAVAVVARAAAAASAGAGSGAGRREARPQPPRPPAAPRGQATCFSKRHTHTAARASGPGRWRPPAASSGAAPAAAASLAAACGWLHPLLVRATCQPRRWGRRHRCPCLVGQAAALAAAAAAAAASWVLPHRLACPGAGLHPPADGPTAAAAAAAAAAAGVAAAAMCAAAAAAHLAACRLRSAAERGVAVRCCQAPTSLHSFQRRSCHASFVALVAAPLRLRLAPAVAAAARQAAARRRVQRGPSQARCRAVAILHLRRRAGRRCGERAAAGAAPERPPPAPPTPPGPAERQARGSNSTRGPGHGDRLACWARTTFDTRKTKRWPGRTQSSSSIPESRAISRNAEGSM